MGDAVNNACGCWAYAEKLKSKKKTLTNKNTGVQLKRKGDADLMVINRLGSNIHKKILFGNFSATVKFYASKSLFNSSSCSFLETE